MVVRRLPLIAASAGLVAACLAVTSIEAFAGPPYRTDDPEPTELGHYEFYVLSSGLVSRTVKSGYLPGIELDYGLIPNGQLTIDTGVSFVTDPSGDFRYGYGDTASLSNTASFRKIPMAGARRLRFSQRSTSRPAIRPAALALAIPPIFFPSGCKKASATGRPMAAAAIGSTRTQPWAIRTTGSWAGWYSAR